MNDDRTLANRSPAAARLGAVAGGERHAGVGSNVPARTATSAPSNLEDALRALAQTRGELSAVRAERDRLQREIVTLGAMQTETVALGAAAGDENALLSETLPTLEDLMAGLGTFEEGVRDNEQPQHDGDESVMLAPELVFEPDDPAEDPRTRPILALKPKAVHTSASTIAGPRVERRRVQNARLLVFVDAEPPIKFPLYKSAMTVGRSETADIRVDGDYISRVHARVTTELDGQVIAEDVASKNGIRVNGKEVKRQALRHGDVLSLGKLHFTFIDTAAADGE